MPISWVPKREALLKQLYGFEKDSYDKDVWWNPDKEPPLTGDDEPDTPPDDETPQERFMREAEAKRKAAQGSMYSPLQQPTASAFAPEKQAQVTSEFMQGLGELPGAISQFARPRSGVSPLDILQGKPVEATDEASRRLQESVRQSAPARWLEEPSGVQAGQKEYSRSELASEAILMGSMFTGGALEKFWSAAKSAQKAALAKQAGLESKVSSKAFAELTEAERAALSKGQIPEKGTIVPKEGTGRQPGGIQKQTPYTPPDEYQRLLDAISPPEPSFSEKVANAKGRIMRGMYAEWSPVRGLAKETGIPVDKYFQVVPGATAAGEDIVRRFYMPVLKNVSKDIDFLEQYMVSMRNTDVLARNPSAKLPGNVGGWGGTLKNIDTIKSKVGVERFRQIETAANELWRLNDEHVLKPMLDNGLLDATQYTAIKSSNPHYIPFQRDDFMTGVESHLTQAKASVSSTGLKKLSPEGSERALSEPLARLQAQAIKAQMLVARNKAAKSLVEALRQAEKQVGEPLVKVVESAETRLAGRVTGENIPTVGKAESSNLLDTVSYFENGKKVTAQVPAGYAQVAKGLEAESVNLLNRIFRTLSAPLRHGAVTYNPAFLIVNPMRDAMSAFFREGLIPLSPDYIRGWIAVVKRNALFSEAAQNGALMSGIVDTMRSADALKRVTQAGAITINNPKDLITLLPRLVAKANLTAEQATRVATFGKLRGQGISGLEAAVKSRDATVDFAKMGTWMRVINDIIPFSNAGVQGTANVLRTIKNNPKWAGLAASPFIMATVLSRTNNLRYNTSRLIPDYEYTNNWVVQIGEFTKADGTRAPLYIKIPKGQLGSMLTFPGEALFNLARSDDDRSAVEAILDTGIEAAKSASPFGSDLTSVLPPIAQTLAGLQTGRDPYTGYDIVPFNEKKLPEEEQYGMDTSSTAVALGQAFNVSPRKIEFAIKDYTAGTGQTSLWLLDLGLGAVGYNPGGSTSLTTPEAVSKAPGTSRFIGTRNTRPYQLLKDKASPGGDILPVKRRTRKKLPI